MKPQESGKLGAAVRWSKCSDRTAATEKTRAGLERRLAFDAGLVDADGELLVSGVEYAKRMKHAWIAHTIRMRQARGQSKASS